MLDFTLHPDDTILVVIDYQDRLLRAMPHRQEALRYANVLLTVAQSFGIPIITTEQYPEGLGSTVAELKSFMKDEDIIEKTDFSACALEIFNQKLRETNRHTIVIIGIEAHVCLYQTVRDLLQQGYKVHVPVEGACSRADENKHLALQMMERLGAVITGTEIVAFDLAGGSQSPHFKMISQLVK